VSPPRLLPFLGLEGSASLIRTYELQFVPGLLQTSDYARAAILLRHDGAGPDEKQPGPPASSECHVRRGRGRVI